MTRGVGGDVIWGGLAGQRPPNGLAVSRVACFRSGLGPLRHLLGPESGVCRAHVLALPSCVTSSFPSHEEALVRELGNRSPEVYAALLTASATVETMASLASIGI